jgi:hypothetical protein
MATVVTSTVTAATRATMISGRRLRARSPGGAADEDLRDDEDDR